MKASRFETKSEWRKWLAKHHRSDSEIWFVFYKKHTGKSNVPYDETVEEALCFGWIDSLIMRLDDDRYARKFTPRKLGSKWSETNKKRVEELVASGRMTQAGLVFVDEAKASGEWDRTRERPSMSIDKLPVELDQALQASPEASKYFSSLAPTYQKQYILWIATAKRPATRQSRAKESIEKLERHERLGLK